MQLVPAAASRWGPASDVVSGTVVVAATFNEDMAWLKQQPYPYVVMTKDPALGDVRHNVPFNKGDEADCFIKFILDNYDDLPPRMYFIHAHEIGRHNPNVRRG